MNDNNSEGSGTGAAGDAARDRAAGDRTASGRAANDRTEAAKAAKAEEKAAKREAQKAAQEAAAAKRAEKKAAKKAKREAEIAQKKIQKEAAKESDEDAADGQSEGAALSVAQGETKEADALPAKVVKGKKPKKSRQAKSSSPKEIRRAIRPIRSRSQQTTARLIWAVFGMALVIVAIAGFWFVLNSQEDTTEIEVLVAAATLTPGSQLERDDVITETIDLQDATISYVPASELGTLVGQTILYKVDQEDLLTFGVFVDSPLGALDGEEGSGSQNEIEFQIEFPGPVTLFPEEGVFAGTRVVIFVVQSGSAEQPGSRFAFEVVDIARGGGNAAGGESEAGGGNEIYLRGSYEYRAWWEKNFTEAYSSSGVSIELEIPQPVDSSIDTLCWRERFRTIYGVGALLPEAYRALIEQLECPEVFLSSLPEGPSSTTEVDGTEPGAEGDGAEPGAEGDDTEPDDNIAERLKSERFSEEREVPAEFIAPAAPSGEGLGDIFEELGITQPGFPPEV